MFGFLSSGWWCNVSCFVQQIRIFSQDAGHNFCRCRPKEGQWCTYHLTSKLSRMAYSQIRLRNGRLFHCCMDFMQLSAVSSSQCTWILNASGPSVSVLRLKAICSTDIWRPLRPDSPKKDSERSKEWWHMDSRCFQRGATKFPPNFLGTSPMEKVQHMVQVLPGIPKWHKKPLSVTITQTHVFDSALIKKRILTGYISF